jgi:cytochrome c55X
MKVNIQLMNQYKWVHKALLLAGILLTGNVGAQLSTEQQARLLHLLRHDCGSCHGMTMKGGLGPALLPESMAARPKELMVQTILEGRSGTAMPPWKTQMGREEALWLVEMLTKGLPGE